MPATCVDPRQKKKEKKKGFGVQKENWLERFGAYDFSPLSCLLGLFLHPEHARLDTTE